MASTERTEQRTCAEAVLPGVPAAVLALDAGGAVFGRSAGWESLARAAGLPADPRGLDWADLWPDVDPELRSRAFSPEGAVLPTAGGTWIRVRGGQLGDGATRLVHHEDRTRERRLGTELERSRVQLRETQALSRIGSWEWDIPANRVTWSDELFRIYGLEPGEMEPSYEGFLGRVHPDDRESVDARNRKAFADHQPFEDVKRIVRPDGSTFEMRTQGQVIVGSDGSPIRMVGVCEDVSEQRRADATRAHLAAIVESSEDAIIGLDPGGVVRSWNPGAERLFGYQAEEVVGRPISVVGPSGREAEWRERLERVLAGEPVTLETDALRADGTRVEVALTISPIAGSDGAVEGVSWIARDVTERRRREEQVRYLMGHDVLTGLPNRRTFEESLGRAVERAGRGHGSAVLVADLDSFKLLNDTVGHPAGDELLAALAQRLREVLGPDDLLVRLGGDEFGVLVDGAGLEEAADLAERLREGVDAFRFDVEGRTFDPTASVGVAMIDGSTEPAGVLSLADLAMYEAKDRGRNRVVVYGPSDGRRPELDEAGDWIARIKEALREDRFVLYYQPVAALDSGRIVHHEALLRMRRETGGIIAPGAFLPAAERFGLVPAIDRWVVRSGLEALAADPELRLFVNLSGHSVGDEALVTVIREGLAETGVAPERLGFEVTETAVISDLMAARRWMTELRELGCRFALDDFGIRFSSFSYLRALPAEDIKIDGSFVRNIADDEASRAIVEAISTAATALGKRVIAEWVESERTAAILRDLGVDLAQGHWVGRPSAHPHGGWRAMPFLPGAVAAQGPGSGRH